MAIEFNGDYGKLNNAQIFGKKVDADAQKKLAAKNIDMTGKEAVDNKYQGEKTDLLDANAFYNSLCFSLGNTKKADVNAQITNIVGASVMKRVAATPQKSVENISNTADFAYDDILADDTQALYAMAGVKAPVNAPNLEAMQETLNNSKFVQAIFA